MIRPAMPADADAMVAIWNPVIRETSVTFTSVEQDPKTLRRRLENLSSAFVAEDQEGIAGFTLYDRFRGGPGYDQTMEHTVMIAPSHQGQGLGRKLMDVLISHARERQVHSLIGAVSGENTGAIHFHRALGFQLVAHIPEAGFKFDRYMDLHLYQKLL